jgi:hypothetical protein
MLFLSVRNQPDLTSDEADEQGAVLGVFTKRHDDPSEGPEAATCPELGLMTTTS